MSEHFKKEEDQIRQSLKSLDFLTQRGVMDELSQGLN